MRQVDFLVAGGGLAAAKCVETLRKEGATGSIVLASAEPHLPYERPPLSKGLLLGYEEIPGIFVHDEAWYHDHDIDVRLSTSIVRVERDRNVAVNDKGDEYSFGKLLIATGSRVHKMSVPGSGLRNIYYLRTLDDSSAIKDAMKEARHAVVVGSGFIGMELVSAFMQNDVPTSMLIREDHLFSKLNSDDLSAFFEQYYRERGVELLFGGSVARFEGDEAVEKIITAAGDEIACDLVAIGIGVSPELSLVSEAGVTIDNGLVVDEYLRSKERPDIFAAGDVANYWDPVFDKYRRTEHWDNAIRHGILAAKNMLGREEPYSSVSYFYSDLFDLSWEFIGDNMDFDETILRGSFYSESAVLFYLNRSVVKAAFLLNRTMQERKQIEKWIVSGRDFSIGKHKLSDTGMELNDLAA